MRILFWLYKAKVNKEGFAPIYIRITVKGVREQFTTSRFVKIDQWDTAKQRIRGRSENAKSINNQLAALKTKIEKVYGEASLLNEDITAEDIKNHLHQKKDELYICQVYSMHNMKISPLVGTEYVKATYNRYHRERDYLKEFIRLFRDFKVCR